MNRMYFFLILSLCWVFLVDAEVKTIKVPDLDGGKDWVVEYEGDIVKSTYREGETPLRKRAQLKPLPWPRGVVPYFIGKEYSPTQRQKIVDALNHIGQQTNNCVRFIPRTNQKDFVYIYKAGKGCLTEMGKSQKGGQQYMMLDDACIPEWDKTGKASQGTVIHEAGHALGFDHTHSRSDRDKYVKILFENVQPDQKFAFKKANTNNELVGFDFHSVMIYGPKAFSKNGQDTIKPIGNFKIPSDSERTELSKTDVEMIRKFYRC